MKRGDTTPHYGTDFTFHLQDRICPMRWPVTMMSSALLLFAPAHALAVYPGRGVASVTVECERPDYQCTTGGYRGTEPWKYYTNHGSLNAAGLHNCTTYAAFRVAQNGASQPSWHGNANQWDEMARAAGLPVDNVPAIGAVAQWNSGNLGHVAYVESIDWNSIVITDDNFRLNVTRRVRIAVGSQGWPDNFIHFADLDGGVRFYGDWDGNGSVTPGIVYRVPGVGLQWHLRNSNSSGPAYKIFYYGAATDAPVVGNWDGVGGDTIGVARRVPGAGLQWHLRNSNSAGPAHRVFTYGASSDVPVTGNWDGIGGDTIGVARRHLNIGLEWHLSNANSSGPAHAVFLYGAHTDMPVVGNWDDVLGDSVGIARRMPGIGLSWHLRNANSSGPAHAVFMYGASSDVPAVGNWDARIGDTVGVVRRRPNIGMDWHLRNANSSGPAHAVFRYGAATAAASG